MKTIEYEYSGSEDPDTKISRETEYENGVPVRKTSYQPGDRRTVVLYRKGKPVVELIYEGEEIMDRRSLTGGEEP